MMNHENGHLIFVDFDPSTKLPSKFPESSSISSDSESTQPQFASLKKEGFSLLGNRRREKAGISSESSEAEAVEKSNSFVGTEEYVAPEVPRRRPRFIHGLVVLGNRVVRDALRDAPLRDSNQNETFYRIVSRRRTKLESAATLGIILLSLTNNMES